MRRFPAFDPPEYVDWKPDPALVRAFRDTVERDAERRAIVEQLKDDAHRALYAGLLRARLHDIQLKRWVKTGVISKAWLGTGEEATTVGPVHALERGQDVVAPMIRNAAACCELGMPVVDMLRAYLGSADAPYRIPPTGRPRPRAGQSALPRYARSMSPTGIPSSQHAAALRIIGATTSWPRSSACTGPTVVASSPVPSHALEMTPVLTQRFSWMSCSRARSSPAYSAR